MYNENQENKDGWSVFVDYLSPSLSDPAASFLAEFLIFPRQGDHCDDDDADDDDDDDDYDDDYDDGDDDYDDGDNDDDEDDDNEDDDNLRKVWQWL